MNFPSAIAVFCGSKAGADPTHARSAELFGHEMAKRGIRLIYGGGRIGLMGLVARAVRDGGGQVTGVIPDFLMQLEVGDTENDVLEVTDSMHSRKLRMFELADAFVSLAGGLGTLDETIEIITWKQLRLHDKPIIVLNEGGYWDLLPTMVDKFIDGGFAGAKSRGLFEVVDDIDALFHALANASAAKNPGDKGRM